MVKSMYSGVAGLKAHQSKMDVIGNNIANVNTWGYKAMDTSFKESIYQTMMSGSAGSTGNGGYGGTNPALVGYGAMVSAITANFTTGTKVSTGRGLDCFIDGTAFFAVGPMYGEGDSKGPSDLALSRVGDFGYRNGYLVDSNGRYLYGCTTSTGGAVWKPTATSDPTEVPDVRIPLPNNKIGMDSDGIGTDVVYAYDPDNPTKMIVTTTTGAWKNLSDLGLSEKLSTDEIKDALKTYADGLADGKTYTYDSSAKKVYITSTDTKNATTDYSIVTAGKTEEAVKAEIQTYIDTHVPNVESFTYDHASGNITLKMKETKTLADLGITDTHTPGDIQTKLNAMSTADGSLTYTYDPGSKRVKSVSIRTQNKTLTLPSAVTTKNADGTSTTVSYIDNKKNDGTATMVTTVVTPAPEGAEYEGPTFDDGRMLLDSEKGSYKLQDGIGTLKPLKIPTSATYYDESGDLQTEDDIEYSSFTVDGTGMIWGTSLNSQRTYLVGAVALVNVPNPSGMNKVDGPYYQPGGSSGEPTIIQSGTTVGTIASGYLESANVDIATEFSNMITTERGFQANSKIITVTDEMLQELVNMKR